MKFPGEILSEHIIIVLIACIVVIVGIVAGANRSAYESYRENAPEIPLGNIPASALTYFAYNMRNALVSLFGIVLAFLSGFGLGISLGITFWLISQNMVYIIAFSHGILEIYSVFLAMVGGLLILAKIGETVWGFFGHSKAVKHVDWRKVAGDYGSLFLFSVIGLFISGWLEAGLSWAILHLGPYFWLVVMANTVISVLIVGTLSFQRLRSLITGWARPRIISACA
jgi:uncharacterized membrane protein SpoIIM required for sporulation